MADKTNNAPKEGSVGRPAPYVDTTRQSDSLPEYSTPVASTSSSWTLYDVPPLAERYSVRHALLVNHRVHDEQHGSLCKLVRFCLEQSHTTGALSLKEMPQDVQSDMFMNATQADTEHRLKANIYLDMFTNNSPSQPSSFLFMDAAELKFALKAWEVMNNRRARVYIYVKLRRGPNADTPPSPLPLYWEVSIQPTAISDSSGERRQTDSAKSTAAHPTPTRSSRWLQSFKSKSEGKEKGKEKAKAQAQRNDKYHPSEADHQTDILPNRIPSHLPDDHSQSPNCPVETRYNSPSEMKPSYPTTINMTLCDASNPSIIYATYTANYGLESEPGQYANEGSPRALTNGHLSPTPSRIRWGYLTLASITALAQLLRPHISQYAKILTEHDTETVVHATATATLETYRRLDVRRNVHQKPTGGTSIAMGIMNGINGNAVGSGSSDGAGLSGLFGGFK